MGFRDLGCGLSAHPLLKLIRLLLCALAPHLCVRMAWVLEFRVRMACASVEVLDCLPSTLNPDENPHKESNLEGCGGPVGNVGIGVILGSQSGFCRGQFLRTGETQTVTT